MYKFRSFYIPDRMTDEIERYVNHGVQTGSFLTAIICNDLTAACSKADDENLANIPAYVAYFYNETPARCFGSLEIMKKWMDTMQKTRPSSREDL